MRLVCPDCLGTLVRSGAGTLQCTTHGGAYELLFLRAPPSPGAVVTDAESEVHCPEGAACYGHPQVAAVAQCSACGRALCATCAFPQSDGKQRCPDCAIAEARQVSTPPTPGPPPTSLEGVYCVQHPQVQATAQCSACGAFLCSTCDFAVADGGHYCPSCATGPRPRISSRRRGLLVAAYVLAVWCTLVLGLLFSGAFESMGEVDDGEVLGLFLTFFLMAPSATGLGLALAARTTRRSNPPVVWLAVAWNGLVLGSFILLCLIGILMEL